MFKSYYTTRMSDSGRQLQMRFIKMRSKTSKKAKMMSAFMAVMLAVMITTATAALAVFESMYTYNGTIIINGNRQEIEVIHFDNIRYLNNDSYYVPLRQVFYLLGCSVNYNVDKNNIAEDIFKNANKTFPYYAWEDLENRAKNEISMQLYGATDTPNVNMPIIEIVKPDGEKWYCQVGSCYYTNAWAPPVVIYNDTAYLPIRALAYFLIPDGEDTNMSILWDESTHNTYYTGRLVWEPDTTTITVNTQAGPGNSEFVNTFNNLRETYGQNLNQFIETNRYRVCVIGNYDAQNHTAIVSIDKDNGKIAVIDKLSADMFNRIFIDIDGTNTFVTKTFNSSGSDELKELKRYELNQFEYTDL